jgi:hypothetical protein
MHSRIFELSRTPVHPEDRFNTNDIPDGFYHNIADYAIDETNRAEDIAWFVSCYRSIIAIGEDGESITFDHMAKQDYFRFKHQKFIEKAAELSAVSLDAFVGDTPYPIDFAVYELNDAYKDKFGFYIYYENELVPMDEFMRTFSLEGIFYFGGTVDYHF